ncbi:MAG: hypothetical protein E6J90_43745 [Deltaproteobacteria bacterium]|nr:MAG: hypothetical protein E6J91_41035 [Deltaproteobacteria bacterium]TMQ07299.1 MAG: hypothetical protein E6J90_43745 [Deltaproteobacteria bacterium]
MPFTELPSSTAPVPGAVGDRLDDAELVARFEALALAPAEFAHREHVRVAYAMLRGADFGDAALRFRRALRRFAVAIGADGRYHETLTWAYLAVIAQRMAEDPAATSLEWLARHPDLLDHRGGAVARHYDVAAITASPLARAVFVLPERGDGKTRTDPR